MAILELLFILLKVIVLSLFYGWCLLLLVILANKVFKSNFLKNILQNKREFWVMSVFFLFMGMIFYKFSYWQDTGLGDNSRIPVGYGQTIQNEDFAWTYFYPDPKDDGTGQNDIKIGNYAIKNNKLCAEVSHEFFDSPKYDYVAYDLKTCDLKTFKNMEEYNWFAIANNLPSHNDFCSFEYYFTEFLNKKPAWKFWLLP